MHPGAPGRQPGESKTTAVARLKCFYLTMISVSGFSAMNVMTHGWSFFGKVGGAKHVTGWWILREHGENLSF